MSGYAGTNPPVATQVENGDDDDSEPENAFALNIPSTVTDPAYRYTMPPLMTKHIGKGKNTRTVITNIGDVARALQIPFPYLCKFFEYELVKETTYRGKTRAGEGEKAEIMGLHEQESLQQLVDRFIDLFILCGNQKCRLPEIDIHVEDTKDGKPAIRGKCKACSWCGELANDHQVATFIVKNHGKLNKKKNSSDASLWAPTGLGELPDTDDAQGQESEEADSEDDDSEVSYRKERTKKVIETMRAFVKEHESNLTPKKFFEELCMQQRSNGFSNKIRLYVGLEALFHEKMESKRVTTQAKYISTCVEGACLSSKEVLWAFEVYLDVNPATEKYYAMVLKVLV
eukprot:gnl/MRDRNA2_/MRDRNA2_17533_c0_seq1.p1 gnl/MRDRNA2_/MRDRNA2_17533_c0~~gnl/MRDRNA2_/MRDRNA2_17533_c0_seq1.p1  ORF type:complete len:343 (+),score=60.07 gnl/MRDRNA2_/MRDRNA2_17533_c0_seq1:116-1144(+)